MDFKCQTIACGFAHSCAVATDGTFYVWGENHDGRIQRLARPQRKGKGADYVNAVIPTPAVSKLGTRNAQRAEDGGDADAEDVELDWYKAMDVACGYSSTLVVAQQKDATFLRHLLEPYPECREILEPLRERLIEAKSLMSFFGVTRDPEHERRKYDSFDYEISRDEFESRIEKEGISNKRSVVVTLAKLLGEHAQTMYGAGPPSESTTLRIGDIEDLALGYLQNNVRVFAVGRLHAAQKPVDPKCGPDEDRGQRIKEAQKKEREELLEKKLAAASTAKQA
jgi:hypothetical protein